MPDFKFSTFRKGWHFRQEHLLSFDGFTDSNNVVVYNNGIEKVRGWNKLELKPASMDDYSQVIDDILAIIDTVI